MEVGGYKLHFTIWKGKGIPILFEAGGGDDGSVWNKLVRPLVHITGATLITYDRAGFGKSTLDTSKHGIVNGIRGLEIGLQKLNYTGDVMLVAHSQGGLYATLYAHRHPDQVKAAVLFDASTSCWFDEKRLSVLQSSNDLEKEKFKAKRPGLYYQFGDLTKNVSVVRQSPFPLVIPVLDLVAENPPFTDKIEIEDWKRCHQEFVGAASKRNGTVAYASGHYIFDDNPSLAIISIVKAYSSIVDAKTRLDVLNRGLDYAVKAVNEAKKEEAAYRHSEGELNSWGYSLLSKGQLEQALAVFKLNVALNPTSWNVYDSYGETLLKNGQKQEAIQMYQKSIELNPGSKNGKKVLDELLNKN
ncbi:hypothetical protein GCM10028808_38920 [Spirosoma migulaei]